MATGPPWRCMRRQRRRESAVPGRGHGSRGLIRSMTWGLLRHGAMNALFGGICAPSTLGSRLRSYTWGNVAQLEKASREFLADGHCVRVLIVTRDPGTFRAHCIASCPEPLRTAEISAAGQPACTVYSP